jgi:hypothetical protein
MPAIRRRSALLALALSLVLAGCGGSPEVSTPGPLSVDDGALPVPSGTLVPSSSPPGDGRTAIASPGPSAGPSAEICERIAIVASRLATLAALELRPTAEVTLDIELSRVQAGFSDMSQDALAARELDLEDSLRRLGYRLDDLALAVEDFRTTTRPREAARHVAIEATAFADALAGFQLQAGCSSS